MGIPGVGKETAIALARQFGTIERLASAAAEDLIQVEGIGAKLAESIGLYFSDAGTRRLLEDLKTLGVESPEIETTTENFDQNHPLF